MAIESLTGELHPMQYIEQLEPDQLQNFILLTCDKQMQFQLYVSPSTTRVAACWLAAQLQARLHNVLADLHRVSK